MRIKYTMKELTDESRLIPIDEMYYGSVSLVYDLVKIDTKEELIANFEKWYGKKEWLSQGRYVIIETMYNDRDEE